MKWLLYILMHLRVWEWETRAPAQIIQISNSSSVFIKLVFGLRKAIRLSESQILHLWNEPHMSKSLEWCRISVPRSMSLCKSPNFSHECRPSPIVCEPFQLRSTVHKVPPWTYSQHWKANKNSTKCIDYTFHYLYPIWIATGFIGRKIFSLNLFEYKYFT